MFLDVELISNLNASTSWLISGRRFDRGVCGMLYAWRLINTNLINTVVHYPVRAVEMLRQETKRRLIHSWGQRGGAAWRAFSFWLCCSSWDKWSVTLAVHLSGLEEDLSCAIPLCPEDAETNSDKPPFTSVPIRALSVSLQLWGSSQRCSPAKTFKCEATDVLTGWNSGFLHAGLQYLLPLSSPPVSLMSGDDTWTRDWRHYTLCFW